MGAAAPRRFGITIAVLGFMITPQALGCGQNSSVTEQEHHATSCSMAETGLSPPTQSELTREAPLAVCAAVEIDQQTLPIVNAGDIVAEQLRKTIVGTSQPGLREKLRRAYFRYLGCM
jgi:hypothetical protein